MQIIKFGALALALAGEAIATTTALTCITQYGLWPVRGKLVTNTHVVTKTAVVTRTSTKTPTVTVTASPVTSKVTTTTSITTSVIGVATTDTATITTTSTATATETDTETDTTTTTVTTTSTVTTQSTVPAPAGFTGVAEGGGYNPKKAREARPKPDSLDRRSPGLLVANQNLYPECVECTLQVTTTKTTTVTTTAKPSTKTLPGTTATSTTTVSTTSTSTVFPPDVTSTVTSTVATTSTVTTTSTTLSTGTTTTTATETLYTTPAYYAACGPDNIVASANGGNAIDTFSYGEPAISAVYVNTAYDCCVACFNSVTPCFAAVYYGGECDLVQSTTATCAAGVPYGGYYETDSSDPGDDGFVVLNGPCGSLTDNGSD
ncbi:hypothetical protein F5Y16DRAFT_391825 [Xylariaceae sp. FL0255]|nr:hypothetical protein F5Y16DRAFT_391825 [Xylariaceae sp. FL0255]